MSDQVDSGSAGNSDQTSGQVSGSEQQNVQQSSQSAPLFSPEQEKYIEEMVRRAEQSGKDRAVSKVEKTLAEQQSEIQRIHDMVKQGMSPQQIEDRMFLDNLKAQQRGTASPGGQPQGTVAQTTATPQQQATPVDYPAIYAALGFEANDAEVIRLTVEHPNPEKLAYQLTQLKSRRLANGNVSAGAVMQPGGGGGNPSTNAQIEQAADKLARLNQDGRATPAQIAAAQKELDALHGR